ncbi:unnamed protein product [Dovyalis caffra]|uniref:Uncharacterized protein n=1 Tax=Dovyalis caffra TaxID=77055 RepID=A0AAV1QVL5_9ROSI|nr:unnamed protein product [Dovyalis caffra]
MRNLPSVYDQGIFPLDDVNGVEHSLRECLPKFNFPVSQETSDAVIVGKWYCPYMFVHETNSHLMFYEMTLKQKWVRLFSCSNSDDFVTGDSVAVDVNVETEVIDVLGMGTCRSRKVTGGTTWFAALDKEGVAASVGLDRVIIEKIIGDQESFGWVKEKDKVKKVAKFEGKSGDWKKFGCYVLVERYVLRGRNRRLVLTYEFRHTHKISCKWE